MCAAPDRAQQHPTTPSKRRTTHAHASACIHQCARRHSRTHEHARVRARTHQHACRVYAHPREHAQPNMLHNLRHKRSQAHADTQKRPRTHTHARAHTRPNTCTIACQTYAQTQRTRAHTHARMQTRTRTRARAHTDTPCNHAHTHSTYEVRPLSVASARCAIDQRARAQVHAHAHAHIRALGACTVARTRAPTLTPARPNAPKHRRTPNDNFCENCPRNGMANNDRPNSLHGSRYHDKGPCGSTL